MYCPLFMVTHMQRHSFVLTCNCKTTHCLGLTCTMLTNRITYITCLGYPPGQTKAFTNYIIHTQTKK